MSHETAEEVNIKTKKLNKIRLKRVVCLQQTEFTEETVQN